MASAAFKDQLNKKQLIIVMVASAHIATKHISFDRIRKWHPICTPLDPQESALQIASQLVQLFFNGSTPWLIHR